MQSGKQPHQHGLQKDFMPTYKFKNLVTGVVYEDFMSIKEMDKLRTNPNIELQMPDTLNIISQTGDNIDAKTDSGWKETLAKISEAHPSSPLANQYGKRKSSTDVKVEQLREKHKTIAKRKAQGLNPLK